MKLLPFVYIHPKSFAVICWQVESDVSERNSGKTGQQSHSVLRTGVSR